MKKIVVIIIMMSLARILEAYEIKLDNNSPFEVVMICDLILGPTKKVTIDPYSSGKANTYAWAMRSVAFTVTNKKTGTTYNEYFVQHFGIISSIGDKHFLIFVDPFITNTVISVVDLYLFDFTFRDVAEELPITLKGKTQISLTK